VRSDVAGRRQAVATPGAAPQYVRERASGVRVVWAGGRGAGRDVVSLVASMSLPLSRAISKGRFPPPLDRRPSAGSGEPSAAVWRSPVFLPSRLLSLGRPAPPGRLETMLLVDELRRSFHRSFPSRRARARNPLLYKNALNERFVGALPPVRNLAPESQEDRSTRKKNIRQMPCAYPANAVGCFRKTSGQCRVDHDC